MSLKDLKQLRRERKIRHRESLKLINANKLERRSLIDTKKALKKEIVELTEQIKKLKEAGKEE